MSRGAVERDGFIQTKVRREGKGLLSTSPFPKDTVGWRGGTPEAQSPKTFGRFAKNKKNKNLSSNIPFISTRRVPFLGGETGGGNQARDKAGCPTQPNFQGASAEFRGQPTSGPTGPHNPHF